MVGEPLGSPLTDDVVVGGEKKILMEPEELPDPPFYAVPHHRVAHFSADGDTQSRLPAPSGTPEHNEMGSADLQAGIPDQEKIPPLPDSFITRKGCNHLNYLQAICTEIFLRPLARRLLMTSLPFLVDMRTRNPWVLLREMLLG